MVISLLLTGDPAEIPGALDALESWLGAAGLSAEDLGEWRLLAEEVLTNIVHHGAPPRCDEAIRIDGLHSGDGVELRVADRGRPFDPCSAAPPDLSAPPKERCGGGLGVHLMRSLADEMAYAYRDGRNSSPSENPRPQSPVVRARRIRRPPLTIPSSVPSRKSA